MGDMIQNALKKMFYVITYYSNGSKYYLSVGGFGLGQARLTNSYKLSPEYNTRQFASVSTALQFLADVENDRSRSLQLIRVEETPGVEQRVLLGELEAAPSGATVKWAFQNPYENNKEYFVSDCLRCESNYQTLDRKHADRSPVLLVDQKDILSTFQNHPNTQLRNYNTNKLVRIAIIPGVPTVTETVLS